MNNYINLLLTIRVGNANEVTEAFTMALHIFKCYDELSDVCNEFFNTNDPDKLFEIFDSQQAERLADELEDEFDSIDEVEE